MYNININRIHHCSRGGDTSLVSFTIVNNGNVFGCCNNNYNLHTHTAKPNKILFSLCGKSFSVHPLFVISSSCIHDSTKNRYASKLLHVSSTRWQKKERKFFFLSSMKFL